ncbi:hypothetical protein FRB94_008155 [Tulasnella sp. JGI-2019a]|nr:hypothetical protein FRB94_008155 [Tulasnella sp. JGI-2019a]
MASPEKQNSPSQPAHHPNLDTSSNPPRLAGSRLKGVAKVEAAQGVWSEYSKWMLYLGIGLASYIYSFDGSTTWFYLSYAQSSFGKHSLISTIQTAQGIIIAAGKPPMAKIADVFGRAESYMVVTFFLLPWIHCNC